MTQVEHMAFTIADRAVVADIEECQRHRLTDGSEWFYDIRPMLDPREQPAEWVDMARLALAYAVERGLIVPHASLPHMVRITRQP